MLSEDKFADEGAGGCTDRVIKELSLRVQREFRIQ